ncbi:hypothetical protein FTW19_24005 [Terriglobus albidus]|uniref:Uncharacterized protein n=1 Tax=Terriglobus albidus TaxID=1592106 RepID=A0A5B9EF17_9BACT|nr:hypothetical protein [Terriglobus albidus]QEE30793.1 hypothetical protein FTW19_24005 [Terriglobus albidus]
MPQNVRLWLHGLGAAFIGGAATSLATILVDSEKFNIDTLLGLQHLAVVAIVAGIVSAAGYLKQSPLPPVEESRTPGSKLAALLVASLLLGSFGLTGCNDFERKTFQTLSASKALIDQAQIDYETGTLPHTQASYDAIYKAKNAQTAAVRAFQVYEAAKLTVDQNSDVTVQITALNGALSNLGPAVVSVKQIYLGGQ